MQSLVASQTFLGLVFMHIQRKMLLKHVKSGSCGSKIFHAFAYNNNTPPSMFNSIIYFFIYSIKHNVESSDQLSANM